MAGEPAKRIFDAERGNFSGNDFERTNNGFFVFFVESSGLFFGDDPVDVFTAFIAYEMNKPIANKFIEEYIKICCILYNFEYFV